MTLSQTEIRVLGALIEKEIATPENYPLSLNALIAASNQKSSRDPVMELTEDEVRQALHSLDDMGLTSVTRDSRVPKYEHRIRTLFNLRRDETAILCLLLLRGAQTPGELRSRADRLYSFDGLEGVESTLARMMAPAADQESQGIRPLVAVLPRQPGSREARYMHLLGGPIDPSPRESVANYAVFGDTTEQRDEGSMAGRIATLEAEVATLRAAIERIETRIGTNLSGVGSTSD
jgi:uncharacterized protein YceH (UPF0502 family)